VYQVLSSVECGPPQRVCSAVHGMSYISPRVGIRTPTRFAGEEATATPRPAASVAVRRVAVPLARKRKEKGRSSTPLRAGGAFAFDCAADPPPESVQAKAMKKPIVE
jgi:hypothetical protein